MIEHNGHVVSQGHSDSSALARLLVLTLFPPPRFGVEIDVKTGPIALRIRAIPQGTTAESRFIHHFGHSKLSIAMQAEYRLIRVCQVRPKPVPCVACAHAPEWGKRHQREVLLIKCGGNPHRTSSSQWRP